MARYIKEYQINTEPQVIHSAISQYLQSEGYEYINYDGENVFKKGNGWFTPPKFFKFSYFGNTLRMETWMKYVFFPGVFAGEFGLTGFVGWAVKGKWKNTVANIEISLSGFAQETQSPYNGYTSEAQPNAQYGYNGYASTQQGAYSVPDYIQTPAHPQAVSRKEFIENYAPQSVKNDIRSIAILCYVCAGLTFVISCLVNPIGIFEALGLFCAALGMQLDKNKVCAILILILSIIECILGLMVGYFPFWWLIAGISSVVTFNKIDKQYKQFKMNLN